MPNNEQLENLLNTLSARLGTSPSSLKDAAQKKDFSNVLTNLNPQDAQKLQRVLSDKDAASKILSTPQAQQLLKNLMKEQ